MLFAAAHIIFAHAHNNHEFNLHLKQLKGRRLKMQKFEVQYYPPNSTNVCKTVVEATDIESAAQIVMAMFNIPRSSIYAVTFAY